MTEIDDAGTATTLVGIGASAGGLAALKTFFSALPSKTDCAFVVIMHLSPKHESHLAELLQSESERPVTEVTELVNIQPEHVYVISPNKQLIATDSTLEVGSFEEPRGRRSPIDLFFRSLADVSEDGIGIVLTGGGSDGSVGIKSIKEKGGLVLVQDPQEAEHDSMPRNAIATGVADVVLPVRELAERLVELNRHAARIPTGPDDLDGYEADLVKEILAQVRIRTGNDLSEYKRATVLRRIGRRMQVNRSANFAEYLDLLRDSKEEAQALLRELLICVTTFFRDPDTFMSLRKEVVPALFEGKGSGDSVRVWVVACSTGEEAYSIALLLLEHAETLDIHPEIQVFATDISQDSLDFARQGIYPKAIETDVSEERLRRFFTEQGDSYRVGHELRDAVLFADHNVLRDPPFSRLDMITCRNMLIYMQRSLQERVYDVFHYALDKEGFLLLGSAETVDRASNQFRTFSKEHHIYQARSRGDVHLPSLSGNFTRRKSMQAPVREKEPTPSGAVAHRRMLEDYAPPSLLVNGDHIVLHLSENAGRFLRHPGGAVTTDVTRLVLPELRNQLRTALFRAFKKNEATTARPIRVKFNGGMRIVYLSVLPRERAAGQETHGGGQESEEDRARNGQFERLALVVFNEGGEAQDLDGPPESVSQAHTDGPTVAQLEEELEQTRERLDATMEEHASAKADMEAANEELHSINEEYKSTTEELETSKEELQSLNEELDTVNRELQSRIEEVTRANSDLQNFIESIEVGTLFLSRDFKIRRYTPKAEELFNIMESDIGRPVTHLTNVFDYDALEADIEEVLSEVRVLEREVEDDRGRNFLMRIRPYRTIEGQIDGIVLTFVDITYLKRTEAELRKSRDYAEHIVDTVREGLVVLDEDLRINSASASFYEMFSERPEDTEGTLIYELGSGQWNIPELQELLEEILPKDEEMNDFEVAHEFEDLGRRVMLLNARRLSQESLILLAIEDVTERKEAIQRLEMLNKQLTERTEQVHELASMLTIAEQEERHRISQVLHDDLQQRLYGIQLKMTQIGRKAEAGKEIALIESIKRAQDWMADAIKTTRQLSVDLSPPVLEGEGLADALGWLSTQMKEMHSLDVEIRAEEHFRFDEDGVRVLLFQIVRELLFNVVKHADVDEAVVELTREDRHLVIRVIDSGPGFELKKAESQHEKEGGFGLFSVRERLGLFGGRMEVETSPGAGTQVTIHVPEDAATRVREGPP